MSDLEQELAGVLARVAEQAPGAVGLADAARRRHRGRRQRRVAVGGAAVALVVGASALVWSDGNDRATDPVDDPAPKGWQTISQDDVRAEVPADWRKVTCGEGEVPRWSPPSGDPCGSWRGAGFFGSATFDPAMGPGVLRRSDDGTVAGYVYVRDVVLSVSDDDLALIRRILSTARVEGQPMIDGSRWVSFERDGMSYEVPAWWGLGQDGDRDGYSVCLYPPDSDKESQSDFGEPYGSARSPRRQGLVFVEAPTQAVAELVLATVRLAKDARPSEECTTEDFTTGLLPGESTPGAAVSSGGSALAEVEHDGIAVSILDTWREKACGGLVQFTPGTGCRSIQHSEGIQFLDASSFEPTMDEGVLVRGGTDGARLWGGYVRRGGYAVWVTHADKETAQTLLDLIR